MPARDASENRRASADALIVAALAAGATQVQAAEKAGVSESTVHRRMQEETFRAQVDEARREMLSRTVGLLAEASTGAVAVLVEIANDSSTPPAARVSAARAILTAQHQQIELHELAQRVADLEQRTAATADKESYAA